MDSPFLPWVAGWVEVSLTTPERQRGDGQHAFLAFSADVPECPWAGVTAHNFLEPGLSWIHGLHPQFNPERRATGLVPTGALPTKHRVLCA